MTPSILDILSILGGIGFVVAGILAVLEVRDYCRPLRLLITYLDCQPTGKETSLVLFRLSFVNHSSRGRTVCYLDAISKVAGIPRIELNTEIEPSLQNVTYSLSSVSRRLPFAETLQLPLDILPNQSLSKWLAVALSYQAVGHGVGTMMSFEAHNPVGKPRWTLPGKNGGQKRIAPRRKTVAQAECVVFPSRALSRPFDYYKEGW